MIIMDHVVVDLLKREIENTRKEMREDLKEMDKKLDELLAFRWKIVGGSVVISAILSFIVTIAMNIIKG